MPAVLIIAMCTYAYTMLRANEASQKGEMTINVTERQFAFEFSYPQASGKQVVSPDLYLAKGQPVVFKIRSLDVIHSFFVPEFSEKIDAVPGITTTLRVTPTRVGAYPVECTELCGAGPLADARGRACRGQPGAFQAWLRVPEAQRAAAGRQPPPNAASPEFPAPASSATAPSSEHQLLLVGVIGYERRGGKAVFTGRPAAAARATRSPRRAPPGRSARTSMPACGRDCASATSKKHPGRPRSRSASTPRSPSLTRSSRPVTTPDVMPPELRPDADVRPRYRRLSTSSRA